MLDEDRQEFTDHYDEYRRRIRGYLLRGCELPLAIAEDLADETLMRALRGWDQFKPQMKHGNWTTRKTWLIAIARNLARNYVTRILPRENAMISLSGSSGDNSDESEVTVVEVVVPDLPSGQTAIAKEMLQLLQKALSQLSAKQRAAIVIRTSDDLTFEELGNVLGVKWETASSQYGRGIIKLREILTEMLESRGLKINDMQLVSPDWQFLSERFG